MNLKDGKMRKLKIGIFTECYHPVLNGVVVSIETFRQALEKRGFEFFIFTTQCPGYHEKNARVRRFNSMIPFPSKGGRYPIAWPQIARLQAPRIAPSNLDLIHSQHLLGIGHLGLKVGRILKIPTILTYHTLLAEYTHYAPGIGAILKWYLIHASREISNQYDRIVTPSPSMKRVLRSYGVRRPIEPIPTGVNIADFQNHYSKEEIRKKWQIPEHQKILLYVSRIAKEKNLDFLFESIERIATKRDDFHLLMVGGGPELKYYQAKIHEWHLKPFVTFTGMQPKKEANRFYGAADIFVFPSITETQGIVVTEAMAAGVPAVAVNQMGPSDIIQDGIDGFLVPLKTDEFTAKIELLLDDDNLRTRMGREARQNARKFSVEACAQKMEKIYERTIDHHRS